MLDIPLQLVTYKVPSILARKGEVVEEQTFHPVYVTEYLVEGDLTPNEHRVYLFLLRNSPEACRRLSVDTSPSIGTSALSISDTVVRTLRTFHNRPHIAYKTMDNTQGLRDNHPSLVLGQSV